MKSCKMCLHSEVCRDNDLVPAHKCEFFISKSQFQQSIAEGDTFYYLVDGHIAIDEIVSIEHRPLYAGIAVKHYRGNRHSFVGDDIGSTVFFSYQEAIEACFDAKADTAIQASIGVASSLRPSELELINQYTPYAVSEDDVFVFSMTVWDNQVDEDDERFTLAALQTLSSLSVGKPVVIDELDAMYCTPKIFSCEVKAVPDKFSPFDHHLYYKVVARAYILKVSQTAAIRDAINTGKITGVSVGCAINSPICSLCGRDLDVCEHEKGHIYGNFRCIGEIQNVRDVYSFTLVDPCTSKAQHNVNS